MLNRLFTAVFVLGLIFVLCGAAFAESDQPVGRDLPAPGVTTSPKAMPMPGYEPIAQPRSKPLTPVSGGALSYPSPLNADTAGCGFENWGDDYLAYLWPMGGPYQGEIHAARYPVPLNNTAEVYGAVVDVQAVIDGSGGLIPDIRVSVWTDLGGLPDAMVYSEDFIMDAYVGAGAAYYGFYFTTPFTMPVPGDFHIGIEVIDGDIDDDIYLAVDDGGPGCGGVSTFTGKSSYYIPGPGWFSVPAVFSGCDYNVDAYGDWCYYYSSCVTAANFGGVMSLWFVPDPVWTSGEILNGFASRFVNTSDDTILGVQIVHFDGSNYFFPPLYAYDSSSTNAFSVTIYGDSAGFLDESDVLAGPIVVGGDLNSMYPGTANQLGPGFVNVDAPLGTPLVYRGAYHVAVSMTSNNDADGAVVMPINSSASNPGHTGGHTLFEPTEGWQRFTASPTWTSEVDTDDHDYFVRVNRCFDEFSECASPLTYAVELTAAYGLPLNIATGINGKVVNRLEAIRWQYIDPSLFSENGGAYAMDVVVWTQAAGGLPGAELYRSSTYQVGDLTPYPGWNELVIPGGLIILNDFCIGYEDVGPSGSYFYFGVERPAPEIFGGAKYYSTGSTAWIDLGDAIGAGANAVMEADFCNIEVPEWTCVPGDDWRTADHDYARLSHSGNSFGDAYCDLTVNWSYTHPDYLCQENHPIIYDTVVIAVFSVSGAGAPSGHYRLFSLNDGTVLSTITGAPIIGSDLRGTPTVHETDIDDAGDIRPLLFFAGGQDANGFGAYDISDPSAPALLWHANSGNTYLGNPNPGLDRYAYFLVLEDGGDERLYFGTDLGRFFACDADDGTPYWGGVTLGGAGVSPQKTYCTDGENIYVGTNVDGLEGDLFALDASTGGIVWQLQTGDELQAKNIYGLPGSDEYDGNEGVEAIAVYDGTVYMNSNCTGDYPTDGIFYTISAATGTIGTTTAANRCTKNNIMVDVNNVYVPCYTRWVGAPAGANLVAFNRLSGLVTWASSPALRNDRFFVSGGAETCEVDVSDQIYVFGDLGTLACFDADTGDEIFQRKITHTLAESNAKGQSQYGGNIGNGVAIAPDHIVVLSRFGDVIDLTKQVDRPRFEIVDGAPLQSVNFGTSPDILVTFPQVYRNNGCADLTVSMVADSFSNGTNPVSGAVSMVSNNLDQYGFSISDQITSTGFNPKFAREIDVLPPLASDGISRSVYNRAANATPVYLNENGTYAGDVFEPPGGALSLAAGDTADVVVHVNQSLIDRGAKTFWVSWILEDPSFPAGTNDLDYFMNDQAAYPNEARPEALFTIIGGCIIDTIRLEFGNGGENFQLVTNTTRLGTGDWVQGSDDNGPGNFIIADGDGVGGNWGAEYYQGGFVYGVNEPSTAPNSYRLAMHTQDWTSGTTPLDGEVASFVSMQPDKNFVDGECRPADSAISLPMISFDGGASYNALSGNAVYASALDSVQNWDDGGGWLWDNVSAFIGPFDDTLTMGLYCNLRTIGVESTYPELDNNLHNMTVTVFDFWKALPPQGRVDTITDWRMGSFHDNDIGGDEYTGYDASISTGWVYDNTGGEPGVIGQIKIPFGPTTCGGAPAPENAPMKGAISLSGRPVGFWDYIYWDSVYNWMSLTGNANFTDYTSDEEFHLTIARKDSIFPDERFSLGVATFMRYDMADPSSSAELADQANLLNKMAGFGRGDIDDDADVDLQDIIRLAKYVNGVVGVNGPTPFEHLGDVDADGDIDADDVQYLIDYYFNYGPCPLGEWAI